MGSAWNERKRIEVVTTWLATGNLTLAAAACGVSRETVKHWRKQNWWMEIVKEVQAEENQELDTKLSKVVKKTLHALEDRVDNGDFILNSKTGEVIRVPVKMKELSNATSTLLQRREVIRQAPQIQEAKEAAHERLSKLAEQFAQMVQGVTNRLNEKVIEGEVHDAVHAEREAGLQDGEREVQLSSGADREAGGTEQSPGRLREEARGPDGQGYRPQETISEGRDFEPCESSSSLSL